MPTEGDIAEVVRTRARTRVALRHRQSILRPKLTTPLDRGAKRCKFQAGQQSARGQPIGKKKCAMQQNPRGPGPAACACMCRHIRTDVAEQRCAVSAQMQARASLFCMRVLYTRANTQRYRGERHTCTRIVETGSDVLKGVAAPPAGKTVEGRDNNG